MSKKIELIFSLPDGSDEYPVEWNVRNTPLADRWFDAFISALDSDKKTMQSKFYGWNFSDQDFSLLVQRINHSIQVINTFYGDRYQILERATLVMNQDSLNVLHHHFELLIGQVWNYSPLIKDVPDFVLRAVAQINDGVHAYETMIRARTAYEKKEEISRGFSCSLLPNDCLLLEDRDFIDFTCMHEPGDLITDYCQLGKSWVDACLDNDHIIHRENISPLRYYSSSFNCMFDFIKPEDAAFFTKKVRKYIKEKSDLLGLNIDPQDPKNAIGHAIYATPAPSTAFVKWNITEQMAFFSQHQKIKKISLRVGAESKSRIF